MKARWPLLALPWLLLLVVALGAAWLRYGLIEPSTVGQQCSGLQAPAWCTWRHWLVLGFLYNVYGIAALSVTALALLRRHQWLAWLAAALGAFALQLYCFEAGALALLIGSLRLLRLQAQTLSHLPPGQQDRPRQRHVQAQP